MSNLSNLSNLLVEAFVRAGYVSKPWFSGGDAQRKAVFAKMRNKGGEMNVARQMAYTITTGSKARGRGDMAAKMSEHHLARIFHSRADTLGASKFAFQSKGDNLKHRKRIAAQIADGSAAT